MERIFRPVMATVLVACLLAPFGILCAQHCRGDLHGCCAASHQVSNGCCSGQVLPAGKASPSQIRSGAATALFSIAGNLPAGSRSTAAVSVSSFARQPALQSPPIVLRT